MSAFSKINAITHHYLTKENTYEQGLEHGVGHLHKFFMRQAEQAIQNASGDPAGVEGMVAGFLQLKDHRIPSRTNPQVLYGPSLSDPNDPATYPALFAALNGNFDSTSATFAGVDQLNRELVQNTQFLSKLPNKTAAILRNHALAQNIHGKRELARILTQKGNTDPMTLQAHATKNDEDLAVQQMALELQNGPLADVIHDLGYNAPPVLPTGRPLNRRFGRGGGPTRPGGAPEDFVSLGRGSGGNRGFIRGRGSPLARGLARGRGHSGESRFLDTSRIVLPEEDRNESDIGIRRYPQPSESYLKVREQVRRAAESAPPLLDDAGVARSIREAEAEYDARRAQGGGNSYRSLQGRGPAAAPLDDYAPKRSRLTPVQEEQESDPNAPTPPLFLSPLPIVNPFSPSLYPDEDYALLTKEIDALKKKFETTTDPVRKNAISGILVQRQLDRSRLVRSQDPEPAERAPQSGRYVSTGLPANNSTSTDDWLDPEGLGRHFAFDDEASDPRQSATIATERDTSGSTASSRAKDIRDSLKKWQDNLNSSRNKIARERKELEELTFLNDDRANRDLPPIQASSPLQSDFLEGINLDELPSPIPFTSPFDPSWNAPTPRYRQRVSDAFRQLRPVAQSLAAPGHIVGPTAVTSEAENAEAQRLLDPKHIRSLIGNELADSEQALQPLLNPSPASSSGDEVEPLLDHELPYRPRAPFLARRGLPPISEEPSLQPDPIASIPHPTTLGALGKLNPADSDFVRTSIAVAEDNAAVQKIPRASAAKTQTRRQFAAAAPFPNVSNFDRLRGLRPEPVLPASTLPPSSQPKKRILKDSLLRAAVGNSTESTSVIPQNQPTLPNATAITGTNTRVTSKADIIQNLRAASAFVTPQIQRRPLNPLRNETNRRATSELVSPPSILETSGPLDRPVLPPIPGNPFKGKSAAAILDQAQTSNYSPAEIQRFIFDAGLIPNTPQNQAVRRSLRQLADQRNQLLETPAQPRQLEFSNLDSPDYDISITHDSDLNFTDRETLAQQAAIKESLMKQTLPPTSLENPIEISDSSDASSVIPPPNNPDYSQPNSPVLKLINQPPLTRLGSASPRDSSSSSSDQPSTPPFEGPAAARKLNTAANFRPASPATPPASFPSSYRPGSISPIVLSPDTPVTIGGPSSETSEPSLEDSPETTPERPLDDSPNPSINPGEISHEQQVLRAAPSFFDSDPYTHLYRAQAEPLSDRVRQHIQHAYRLTIISRLEQAGALPDAEFSLENRKALVQHLIDNEKNPAGKTLIPKTLIEAERIVTAHPSSARDPRPQAELLYHLARAEERSSNYFPALVKPMKDAREKFLQAAGELPTENQPVDNEQSILHTAELESIQQEARDLERSPEQTGEAYFNDDFVDDNRYSPAVNLDAPEQPQNLPPSPAEETRSPSPAPIPAPAAAPAPATAPPLAPLPTPPRGAPSEAEKARAKAAQRRLVERDISAAFRVNLNAVTREKAQAGTLYNPPPTPGPAPLTPTTASPTASQEAEPGTYNIAEDNEIVPYLKAYRKESRNRSTYRPEIAYDNSIHVHEMNVEKGVFAHANDLNATEHKLDPYGTNGRVLNSLRENAGKPDLAKLGYRNINDQLAARLNVQHDFKREPITSVHARAVAAKGKLFTPFLPTVINPTASAAKYNAAVVDNQAQLELDAKHVANHFSIASNRGGKNYYKAVRPYVDEFIQSGAYNSQNVGNNLNLNPSSIPLRRELTTGGIYTREVSTLGGLTDHIRLQRVLKLLLDPEGDRLPLFPTDLRLTRANKK